MTWSSIQIYEIPEIQDIVLSYKQDLEIEEYKKKCQGLIRHYKHRIVKLRKYIHRLIDDIDEVDMMIDNIVDEKNKMERLYKYYEHILIGTIVFMAVCNILTVLLFSL